MRVLVCLLLVLSPTLFAALTSHHGETAAAPAPAFPTVTPVEACTHPLEFEAAHPIQRAQLKDRVQTAHSTR